jgi:hypothetical protein
VRYRRSEVEAWLAGSVVTSEALAAGEGDDD